METNLLNLNYYKNICMVHEYFIKILYIAIISNNL
jgi:hypothetical protein